MLSYVWNNGTTNKSSHNYLDETTEVQEHLLVAPVQTPSAFLYCLAAGVRGSRSNNPEPMKGKEPPP